MGWARKSRTSAITVPPPLIRLFVRVFVHGLFCRRRVQRAAQQEREETDPAVRSADPSFGAGLGTRGLRGKPLLCLSSNPVVVGLPNAIYTYVYIHTYVLHIYVHINVLRVVDRRVP